MLAFVIDCSNVLIRKSHLASPSYSVLAVCCNDLGCKPITKSKGILRILKKPIPKKFLWDFPGGPLARVHLPVQELWL